MTSEKIRKMQKSVKIPGGGPLVTLKGPLGDHSTGPGGFFHLHPLIGGKGEAVGIGEVRVYACVGECWSLSH